MRFFKYFIKTNENKKSVTSCKYLTTFTETNICFLCLHKEDVKNGNHPSERFSYVLLIRYNNTSHSLYKYSVQNGELCIWDLFLSKLASHFILNLYTADRKQCLIRFELSYIRFTPANWKSNDGYSTLSITMFITM